MAIDKAKFRKPVLPGDQLHYHVRKIRNRGRVWRFYGEAKVDGKIVAEAEISAMLADTAEARAFAQQAWLRCHPPDGGRRGGRPARRGRQASARTASSAPT